MVKHAHGASHVSDSQIALSSFSCSRKSSSNSENSRDSKSRLAKKAKNNGDALGLLV